MIEVWKDHPMDFQKPQGLNSQEEYFLPHSDNVATWGVIFSDPYHPSQ